MTGTLRTLLLIAGVPALAAGLSGCTDGGTDLTGLSSFQVDVTKVNGKDPPKIDAPLAANIGTTDDAWDFAVQAVDAYGNPVDFEGYARIEVQPGSVDGVEQEGALGRNIFVTKGKAAGKVLVTAMYGPTRLWVEDAGFVPVDPSKPPACADGKDNDQDGRIDYPADPGCAFANDDTEDGGTYAAGVSEPVHYALPRIADVQGSGTATPYPFQGIQANTDDPQHVIVTRVASDGFYVTDIAGPAGASNSLFAFNFNTPSGMRVCDRITYLSGTMSEFFGFTEMNFPSYNVSFIKQGQGDCEVPEPIIVDGKSLMDPVLMETLESALVRVQQFTIADFFGPGAAVNNHFDKDHSSCDLNGDGQVDFANAKEAACSDACSNNAKCSEWTNYSARGNYVVYSGSTVFQINTGTVTGFDPPSHKGEELPAVTGTMREFSGGNRNWTIETRCADDLCLAGQPCAEDFPNKLPSSKVACVRLRTTDDPDEATN
jgi:hypothetical protein